MVYEPISFGTPAREGASSWQQIKRLLKPTSAGRALAKLFSGTFGANAGANERSLVDRIDKTAVREANAFQLFDTTSLRGSDIVIVGEGTRGSVTPFSPHFSECRSVMAAADFKSAERILFESDAPLRVLLINIEDVDQTVDWLLRLRAVDPDIVTIATSADFEKNDLSSERAAICDASLRQPVTPVTLSLGVTAAITNHRRFYHKGAA